MTKVVSLFSGCGGLDLGFKWAGFDIVWAIDKSKEACDTYRQNIGNEIICGDIREIDYDDVPQCDVMIGGPPCQAFSLVGKRNSKDENFMMIWEFYRAIESKNPQAFVMENVPGLRAAIDSDGYLVLPRLIKKFENLGYAINFTLINSADYGIPQRRKRLVLIGSKSKQPITLISKTHSNDLTEIRKGLRRWVSSKDAIGDLPSPSTEDIPLEYSRKTNSAYGEWARWNNDKVANHWIPTMSELDRKIIHYIKEGGNYKDVPDDIPSKRIQNYKKTGGRTTTYGRLNRKMPAYTINTYFSRLNVGCNIHYTKNRLITIREGMRLQSFPDKFVLPTGLSKRSQYMLVGNAVPPLLGMVIAESINQNMIEIKPNRRKIPNRKLLNHFM